MNGIVQFWWRGAFGGAVSSALLTLVLMIDAIQQWPYNIILVSRLAEILFIVGLFGGLAGAIVGSLLCCLSIRFEKGFSFVARILVGTAFMHILIGPLFYFFGRWDGPIGTREFFKWLLIAALTIGGSAALASPSREGVKPDLRQWPGGVVR
jgi:hypothetical protein